MGSKQHHFVLVHGAGHGAWCWYKVTAVLEKAGHRVSAIDLASAGENTEVVDDITSLEEYSRPLEDLLKSLPDDQKVILVGHSLGGLSLALMSELFPKKISVAVYVAALMPTNGTDYFLLKATNPEFLPQTYDPEFLFHSKVEGGPVTSLAFPLERLRKEFYNKCSDEDFAFAVPRFKRFPSFEFLFRPIHTTEENYGTVPRIHILGLHDLAISVASCRIIVKLNPPNEAYEIDADHSLFFSGLEDTTKILIDAAAKYDA
jgi:pimeloyl-ACP methyl ester carboxylesterase